MDSRIAALHLWALPLEVQFPGRSETSWDETIATAVRTEVRGRWILESVSMGAMQAGVRAGMTLSEAKARIPNLDVKNRDLAAERRALSRAAEFLFAFGPVVEVCEPDILFVEIGRSEKVLSQRLGLENAEPEVFERAVVALMEDTLLRAGHAVSVVLGQTPDATRTLAQHLTSSAWPQVSVPSRLKGRGRARGVSPGFKAPKRPRRAKKVSHTMVVPPGGEARAQARLPLSTLAWTDLRQDPDRVHKERIRGALASLRVLGINDVGRLATMPSSQIASRFGEAGHTLMQRALGQADRPLKVFRPPDKLVERSELDQVTEDLEPVLFLLQGLLSRLTERLDARALSVHTVDLSFVVEPSLGHVVDMDAPRPKSSKRVEKIPLRFARPTRTLKTMMALARDRLGGALPGAVRGLSVTAVAPNADHGAQLDLFTAHERRLEAVGELVGRLQVTLGDRAVFSPELRDTHRPEAAWRAGSFDIDLALRRSVQAKPKRVEVAVGPVDTLMKPHDGAAYQLPSVQADLRVTGQDTDEEPAESAALGLSVSKDPAKAKPWPKPVKREPADEPLVPLPPRPLMILPEPEQATVLKSSGVDEGVLLWRGQRHNLVQLGGREKLEAEWWTRAPVERNYVVAEAVDGRRFWVYFAPEGQAYVHGIFD